ADRLVVSGGNVGIGTSSPTAKLEIQGTGSSLIVRNNTDVHLFVNGTTGNVGIGTTAPTTKLQVHESGNFNSQLTISTNSENYNSILAFTTNASGNPKDARIGLDTANSVLKLVYGAPFASSTNGIMIDSSGRVGIGTSTPTAKLEIQGTGSSLIVRNNTNVHLFVNGTTGNVGIGIINPGGYKLYVDGVIYASGSSKFYKKEIEPLQNTERIYNLTPVSFLYKEEYEHFGKKTGGNKQIGLIAEDVAKYYPELAIFINGYPTNVDYEKLSVVLLAEIQKQNEKINYLENQIKNMNDKKVICNESYN
ncbi:MAG: tail fiber domain-containing protein, partial [Candidatus Aenigmarchaeota archaeon]|nr:tail fiber domain-containing protein [Candidatus Aenigmarchaeota archaeon]